MGTRKNFDLKDRKMIETLVKKGMEFREIGEVMQRSPHGVRSEIMLNGGFLEYNAEKAQDNAIARRKEADLRRIRSNKNKLKNPYGKQNEQNVSQSTSQADESGLPQEERIRIATFVYNLMKSPEMTKFLSRQ